MKTDELVKYASGLNASENIIDWINTTLNKYKKNISLDTAEHIIDYMMSDQCTSDLRGMSVKQAVSLSEKWTEQMNSYAEYITESPEDTKVVMDFGDGFKFVRLRGENAYKREGLLMRHCVASYYGKDVKIYSLRDAKNMPHCTIEKDNQIKGKGNGDISPKYIDYVVKFLEKKGMTMRDSGMSHLGYNNVESLKPYIKNKLYRDKYIRKNAKIIAKEGYKIINHLRDINNDKIIFNGNLDLSKYKFKLPDVFTHCNGDLELENYNFKLPDSFTHCGGNLELSNYKFKLPEGFTHCGGDLDLTNYGFKLPKSFTHCGGNLYLSHYKFKLPDGFTHCNGDLYLSDYGFKLPDGFTHCGGNLYLPDYGFKLPEAFKLCGGRMFVGNYKLKLPDGLKIGD